jgi:hypothetical protein
MRSEVPHWGGCRYGFWFSPIMAASSWVGPLPSCATPRQPWPPGMTRTCGPDRTSTQADAASRGGGGCSMCPRPRSGRRRPVSARLGRAWPQPMQAGSVSMGGRGSRRPAFRAKKLSNEGCPVLDDAWVMIRGYRNRRGETDQLLVGPGGVGGRGQAAPDPAACHVRERRHLDSRSCERIVALIRRDHQFHERRRNGSGGRGDRRG